MTIKSRLISTATVAALAAVVLAPATAWAAGTGSIAGTVTSSPGVVPIANTRVCASSQSAETYECANTNSSGEYTITGLASGEYIVEFTGFVCPSMGSCSHPYILQYYNGQSRRSLATSVAVNGAVTGINASLARGGSITGTVKSESGTPIANTIVCAADPSVETYECAPTNPSGEYTVEGLPSGEYNVEFTGFVCTTMGECTHPYVAQYSSSPVTVTAPLPATGPNASLEEAGSISGKVSGDSVGNPPIEGMVVCTHPVSGPPVECASTNPAGEYKLEGLASGEYIVEFTGMVCSMSVEGCPRQYVPQFYNGKASSAEAEPVTVSAPNTTTGINAAMAEEPKAPANTAAPALTGQPALGQTLNCSQGAWANNPVSFAYAWLRDGSAIPGQASSSYTVQSADQGHAISCEVTASNSAGAASATSSALQIPAAPTPPATTTTGGTTGGTTTTTTTPPQPPTEIGSPAVNRLSGQITFDFDFPEPGQVVATAQVQEGASLAKRKACRKGFLKRRGKCISNAPVVYGSTELDVTVAGAHQIVIKPRGKALAALRKGKTLVVRTTIAFTPAGSTDRMTKVITTSVRLQKKGKKHKKH